MTNQFSQLSKSRKSTEYQTPFGLYTTLNKIFKFQLDPCTTQDNPLGTATFYTKEQDGLTKPWNTNTYINPPFGSGVKEWIDKMITESNKNPYYYVMLLPARTDTKWFQDLIWKPGSVIYFLKGRLKFVNPQLNARQEPHIIGSMLWIRNATLKQKEELIKSIPGVIVDL